MKLLLDTNVLLDFCNDARAPFHSQCVDLLLDCASRADVELIIAVSSLNDVYYVLRRHYSDEQDARKDIGMLMELFDVCPLLARHARMSYESDEPDFEDGLVRAIAEDNAADVIVTRDASAFRRSKVPAMDAVRCRSLLAEGRKA
ncbi:PIN domain-containing protein [Bifidobacterium stellenboschense]|uniref:PilT protein domain-containing protein n=1 Tax=Bifidobacterium stellenboschense TaxID=762211 RepID=A0A087DZL3_9BIFI|nr:PIN domain-containing protein [Bifidobacterium stellenboschense]KFJ00964.1 PilT protein domain-containing protein [Bifidobacterium stellenboschense]